MSNKDFGGDIALRFSTGEVISLRGTMTLMTAGRSADAVVNQDETIDRVSTPTAKKFEISFADRGFDYSKLMKGDRFDATFIERDNGITHYFTRCFLSGEPSRNRINGEVTGVTGVAERYNQGS